MSLSARLSCLTMSAALVAFALPSAAHAQSAPAPPPGFSTPPPPPPYYALPPGYAPPPGYAQPAPLGPKSIDYEDGDPVPPGYHKRTHARKGMAIGGGVTFGALYVFTLLTAAVGDSVCSAPSGGSAHSCNTTGWRELYIPVAGPFVAIAGFGGGGGTAALVIDGIGQAAGFGLLVAGIAMQQTELTRDDVSKRKLFVTPTMARGSSGVGVGGTF